MIRQHFHSTCSNDNIIAALGYNDRAYTIKLKNVLGSSSLVENVLATMQKSVPALKLLKLETEDDVVPVIPDSFLGKSAPQLGFLYLTGITFPFPVLRKLLQSASLR